MYIFLKLNYKDSLIVNNIVLLTEACPGFILEGEKKNQGG